MKQKWNVYEIEQGILPWEFKLTLLASFDSSAEATMFASTSKATLQKTEGTIDECLFVVSDPQGVPIGGF